jgi:hypothetical protein
VKAELTQARLKELLHYEPESGLFKYRVERKGRASGSVAGRQDSSGYIQIGIDGLRIFAHHLAFLYMEGAMPLDCVDHINRLRADNSWANLRQADRSSNAQNRAHRSDNTSGVKGVSRLSSGKWQAAINYRGKRHYLGAFDCLEDAKEFIGLAREVCHGEFACAG